jgi:hypothetical protein
VSSENFHLSIIFNEWLDFPLENFHGRESILNVILILIYVILIYIYMCYEFEGFVFFYIDIFLIYICASIKIAKQSQTSKF